MHLYPQNPLFNGRTTQIVSKEKTKKKQPLYSLAGHLQERGLWGWPVACSSQGLAFLCSRITLSKEASKLHSPLAPVPALFPQCWGRGERPKAVAIATSLWPNPWHNLILLLRLAQTEPSWGTQISICLLLFNTVFPCKITHESPSWAKHTPSTSPQIGHDRTGIERTYPACWRWALTHTGPSHWSHRWTLPRDGVYVAGEVEIELFSSAGKPDLSLHSSSCPYIVITPGDIYMYNAFY